MKEDLEESFSQEEIKALQREFKRLLHTKSPIRFKEDEYEALMEHYFIEEDFESGIIVSEFALEQYPYIGYFYICKAEFLIPLEKFEEAKEVLRAGQSYNADEYATFYLLESAIFLHEKKYNEAHLALNQASKRTDEDEEMLEIHVSRADICLEQENFKEAYNACLRGLKLMPTDPQALEILVIASQEINREEETIAYLSKSTDEFPYSYWNWFNLGVLYYRMERFEEAIEAFDYAVVINEEEPEVYRLLGACALESGEPEKALQYFAEGEQKGLKDADFHYRVGIAYSSMQQFDKGAEAFEQSIKIDPQNPDSYFNLSGIYLADSKFKQALDCIQKARKLDPENINGILAEASTYTCMEREEEAAELYHKALSIDPSESKVWIYYVAFSIMFERYESFDRSLEIAIQNDPAASTLFAFAAWAIKAGKRKEGIRLLYQAIELDYESFQIFYDLIPEMERDIEVNRIFRQAALDQGLN